ncbi:uncharacterized protein LOC125659001 [Ostrea edulis]|uniref:uncharacterized protein LOC125659001 n=1 Tax=Ostrea edulis TaxID=37623 RepID=UPI0024AF85C0|nr:uncharacterized protein LOC125659001 [Ostrea edulis]
MAHKLNVYDTERQEEDPPKSVEDGHTISKPKQQTTFYAGRKRVPRGKGTISQHRRIASGVRDIARRPPAGSINNDRLVKQETEDYQKYANENKERLLKLEKKQIFTDIMYRILESHLEKLEMQFNQLGLREENEMNIRHGA